MSRPLWSIDKDTTHGTSFRLAVGVPGIPGSHEVSGLSRDQAQSLEAAITTLESSAKYLALEGVRKALGIRST